MKPQKTPTSCPRIREKPTLPSDFASSLLAAEFELEKHCTVEHVNALVGLYQQAIEFYEHKGDSRFVDYQARMHKMFMRGDVQAQLNPSSPPTFPDSPTKQKGPKLRREATMPSEAPIKQTRKLEHLFEQQKKVSSSAASNVKKDVADQHSNLNQRLAQRKLNKSSLDTSGRTRVKLNATFDCELGSETSEAETASFSFLEEMQQEELREERNRGRKALRFGNASPPLAVAAECDRSGGFPRDSSPKHIDDLAKQIEDVMERIYSERAAKECEIKVKYESQIVEMQREMNGSDFMRKIVDNMREEMRKEMDALWSEMDAKRKREIKAITEEYTG